MEETAPDDDQEVDYMSFRRIAFAGAAALLGLGLAGVPATMAAADTSTNTTSTTASTTAPPVVTDNGSGSFTVTLPGIGSLSFTVDTTGALTGLTVAPEPGVTAAPAVPTSEGVSVVFTSGTASQVLEVEVHMTDSGPKVTAEVDVTEPPTTGTGEEDHGTNSGGEENHGSNPSDDHPSTTPTTVTPGTVPAPKSEDGGGAQHGDDNGSESHAPWGTVPASSTAGTSHEDDQAQGAELGHSNVFGH